MSGEPDAINATIAKQLTDLQMALATRSLVDACTMWRAVVDAGNNLAAVRAVGNTLKQNDHALPPELIGEISGATDVLNARHWASSAVVGLAENVVDAWMKVQAVEFGDADTINAVVDQHQTDAQT